MTEAPCPAYRDQPGDGGEPSGYCQHPAVPTNAQILERKALGSKETGEKHDQILFSSFSVLLSTLTSLVTKVPF